VFIWLIYYHPPNFHLTALSRRTADLEVCACPCTYLFTFCMTHIIKNDYYIYGNIKLGGMKFGQSFAKRLGHHGPGLLILSVTSVEVTTDVVHYKGCLQLSY
jgi:hypothetical protein